MTLTLTITNTERLDDGAPLYHVLDRRGAIIGRSARCDWRLPDPDKYVSSRHCEISYADGHYTLTDTSTNGTMLNGATERMSEPRPIERGDRFKIGRYDIVATLGASAAAIAAAAEPAFVQVATPPVSARPAASDAAPAKRAAPSSKKARTPAGEQAAPAKRPRARRGKPDAISVANAAAVPAPTVEPTSTVPPVADDPLMTAFAAAAGVERDYLKSGDAEVLERAGLLLQRMVAGLMTLVEDRARAKSEMGAERTALSFLDNNPIKFARRPEQALVQLLNPQERGFMAPDVAVDDAFRDLQAHQMATLRAMQGALRATLDRFSPTAIKQRAENKGLLAKIIPSTHEASLWQAYEREFAGVAAGSDDAFMDVFAREFREAYLDLAGKAS